MKHFILISMLMLLASTSTVSAQTPTPSGDGIITISPMYPPETHNGPRLSPSQGGTSNVDIPYSAVINGSQIIIYPKENADLRSAQISTYGGDVIMNFSNLINIDNSYSIDVSMLENGSYSLVINNADTQYYIGHFDIQ
jgi:hypothetical protein